MSPTQPDAASRAIEPRQRLIGLAIIVGLALVVGLIVAALRPPAVTPGAPGTGPAGPAASTSATPTASIPQAAREKVWTSDMAATGKYALNGVVLPPGKSAPSTKKYVVKVETSVPQQADDVARQVHGILSDERSWVGYGKTNFELVASKNLGILTPFVSIGGAAARANLVASGAAVFDPSFTVDQSATGKPSGALYRAGLEIHLLVIDLAAEYERVLGADRFNAKLAAGF